MTQANTVTRYVTDPFSRQAGRPMTYKTAAVLTTAKSGHEFPRGLEARTD